MDALIIVERLLPDGRTAVVWPLMYGRARLSVGKGPREAFEQEY